MHTLRCTLRLAFLIAAAVTTVTPASAQNSSSGRNSVRRSERMARDSWQPVRTDLAIRQVAFQDKAADTLPTPVADAVADSASVMDGQIIYETAPGEVIYESGHGGVLACDAMPMGGCGCGSMGCDGGCDSFGCDGSCGGGCDSGACCGELCSPNAWRPCVTLCTPQDGWASFEYLNWWQDGMSLPPLITSSTDPNVARANAGVLGQPTTTTLFGGRDVLTDSFDGGRFRFGVWLDECHKLGIGAEFFNFSSQTEGYSATSTGNPVLARPFFNVLTGLQDSELVAFTGSLSGTVSASARSELSSASINFRRLRFTDEGCSDWLFCGRNGHYCGRSELIFGYRNVQLDENVTINENLVSTDTSAPGSFDIFDQFDTRNQFNGFDLGWKYKRTRGYWSLETLVRLGIGNNQQTVTINGQTVTTDPLNLPAVTAQGGLLAQRTNIGVHQRDEFSIIPELGATLGYQLTDHLKATLGYNFIYWSNVVRPGEHIPTDVNPNLLPPEVAPFVGAERPAFAWDSTDYWVQGISVGAEYRW